MLTKRQTKQRDLTSEIRKLLAKRDGLRKEIAILEAAFKAGSNEMSKRRSSSPPKRQLSICS